MADIKLRIEVNSDAETELLGNVTIADETKNSNTGIQTTNNIYKNIPTVKIEGVEGLSLAKGYLVFNEDGYLANVDTQTGTLQSEENPSEFVWGATDENGNYELTLTFTNCRNLDKIVIYGDDVSKQFPIEAYLDDSVTPIYSDDSKWAIKFENPASTHTIKFTKWNRANYNAVITLIRVMLRYLDVDKFNGLKSVDSLSQSTGQPNVLHYGVVPNTGAMEVLDVNGEVLELIESGIIPNSNLRVQLLANGKQVQEHITNDSDYNITTKIFTGDLSDELSQWDKLEYMGYSYKNKPESAYTLLYNVLSSIGYTSGKINEMLSESIIYGDKNAVGSIKSYLERIIIQYPYLEADNVRNTIEKFCRLAQLQVFKKDNGNICFVSARPIATPKQVSNALSIPKGSQSKPFSKSVVLKNKYEAVEILEKKVTDSIDYSTVVGSLKDSILSDKETNSHNNETSNTYQKTGTSGGGSSALQHWTHAAYGYVKTKYTSGTIVVPKLRNSNLEQVLEVYTGTDGSQNYIKHSVTYEKKVGTATRFYSPTGSGWGALNTSINEEETTTGTSIISQAVSSSSLLTVSLPNDTNLSTITYTINSDGDYVLNYTVLIGKEIVTTQAMVSRVYLEGDYAPDVTTTGTIEIYEPQKLEISIYGDKRVISFEDVSVSDENVSKVDTFASVENSELLQDQTMFDEIKMSELIKQNIKEDYKNGVSNGKLTIPCVDIFDKNQTLQKDWWNKGQIIETKELLDIEGDNNAWRVTGRHFKKNGVPLLDLEVQQIKQLEREPLVYDGGLYSDSSYSTMTASWEDMINDGTITLSEDCFSLSSVDTSISGYLKIDSNIREISSSACEDCVGLLGVNLMNVTSINNSAFRDCSSLSKVLMTDSLVTIGSNAFKNCTALSTISLPNKLQVVGSSAFESCTKLSSIVIPDSVTSLGGYAFGACSGLKSATIGTGLSELMNVFTNCTALTSIVIPENIRLLDSTFFNCTSLTEVTLSEGLQVIGASAFEKSGIYEIVIPSTVYEIIDAAFVNCNNLSSVTFKRTTGWRASDNSQYYEVSLLSPSTNATYLKETYPCHWYNDEIG